MNKYAINSVTMSKALLSALLCKGVRHVGDILKYTVLYLTCYLHNNPKI